MSDIKDENIVRLNTANLNREQTLCVKAMYNWIETQQAEITRLNYLVASQKETMGIMQDIIDTEKLKGIE